MKNTKLKKYKLWKNLSIILALIVLLDNAIYLLFKVNIIPTIFLYTIGQFGSLSVLNFIVYLWSRLWIALFIVAFVLSRKIIKLEKNGN